MTESSAIYQAGQVISYGAGVNSTAMAIMLINQGWKGQIVFSDTGCEWPETMCYIDYFQREWLQPRGFEIIRLKGLPYQVYLKGHTLIEWCELKHILPLAAVRWCTMESKVRPMQRWCAANGNPEQLIGIALDESHRIPDKKRPLVDEGITREDCYRIIEAEGLSVPRKSGCYICPFQRVSGWLELWKNHQDLFERAAKLEETTPRTQAGNTHATLDPSGRYTLRQRQFAFEHQIQMFDQIYYDDLLRFKPCRCETGSEP